MKVPISQRIRDEVKHRVLFVWDGTSKHLKYIESFLERLKNPRVHVIHPMPHESIYSYGAVGQTYQKANSREESIQRAFRLATTSKPRLNSASFQVLFGDTVSEIARFSKAINATVTLLPTYQQSNFSKWIHGNLNESLVKKTHCDILFLIPSKRESTLQVELKKGQVDRSNRTQP